MEKHVAFLRVVGSDIKPYTYTANVSEPCVGESLRVKGVGGIECGDEIMPASFHFTTPPGDGVVPPTGDWIKVTIERATREEMESLRPGYLIRQLSQQ